MVYLLGILIVLIFIISIWHALGIRRRREEQFEVKSATLSHEALLDYAQGIAREHEVTERNNSISFMLNRMNGNYKYISNTYREISEMVNRSKKLLGEDEWLLDNFYIIEEQINELRQTINKRYFRKLPVMNNGSGAGLPRAFIIALELVNHTDNLLTKELMTDFIESYQRVSHLKDVEIWSLPIMLRMALLENIRQICARLIKRYEQNDKANKLVKELCDAPTKLNELFSTYFKKSIVENSALFETLFTGLRRCQNGAEVISLIDDKLQKMELSREGIISIEHQKQASRQVSIGNIIGSLRYVQSINYIEIFERLSFLEKILSQDPAHIYLTMDEKSKEVYRKKVENIARKLKLTEIEVAKRAIDLAEGGTDEETRHIGQYIVATELGKSMEFREKMRGQVYTFANMIFTFTLTSLISYSAYCAAGIFSGILVFLLTMIPISDIVLNITNYATMRISKPSTILRLDFSKNIPEDRATFVVISALLSNADSTKQLAKQLELYYLANRSDNLYFGILSDFADADSKKMPDDNAIFTAAEQEIKDINKKYGNKFFLFNRERVFDKHSRRYMGYERKRGAILEFARLLRGERNTNFQKNIGDFTKVPHIKYVVTLDSDTQPQIGTITELIGAMSHPLNKPKYNEDLNRVESGYGLMQPRINVDICSASSSKFAQIFAGQGGIDTYSGAISDIYQDVFGEGTFTGKGIFDVDVFLKLLPGAIPDNTVLSHDLLEGCYVRCGLVSDVVFTDGFPAKYNSYAARLHRWIRGDWQLIPWLSRKKKLSGVSKWKILDNLRRSIIPIALLIITVLAFNILPINPLLWVALVVITIFCNLLISTVDWINTGGYKALGQKNHATIVFGLKGALYQAAISFILIPHNAYIGIDAIIRTLFRVYISHNKMLEWVTAADVDRKMANNMAVSYRKMFASVVCAVILGVFSKNMSILAWIIAITWTVSPMVLYFLSKKYVPAKVEISADEKKILRKLTRQTWQYFEDFVNEKGHFLPPDNFQESPPNYVAYRTSPTNIGLYLTSILAAYDFGYITGNGVLRRLERTLDSIDSLEKWRGHLLNWYDTKKFSSMHPRYVSTVDSGNFIGYLMTLKEGLCGLRDSKMLSLQLLDGLKDVMELSGVELEIPGKFNNDTWQALLKKCREGLEHNRSIWARAGFKQVEECSSIKIADTIDSHRLDAIVDRLDKIIKDTNFLDLYDEKRKLFSIGHNLDEGQLTKAYYDLLASEARQTSFIAVAMGQVDKEHWFTLGRSLVARDGYRGLVSWTGTMFEYLMPNLIMKTVPNTLMDETNNFVLRIQKKYGRLRGVPWGTSESGYNAFDINLNYQYKAFGVPDLGLKRGLISDMVIAPYATILATMVDFSDSMKNIQRLTDLGVLGKYGFYEAADYTPGRVLPNQEYSIVKSYMAHHQAMSIVALDNVLHDNIMQKRFHNNAVVRSAEELLCERAPINVVTTKTNREKVQPLPKIEQNETMLVRKVNNINPINPTVHVLSNGKYSVVLTDSGSGYSCYNRNFVTRWRDELFNNFYGNYIYIKNIATGKVYGATKAPVISENVEYGAEFYSCRAKYFCKNDDGVDAILEVVVSPEEDAEIRYITLNNHSENEVILEIISFLEVILGDINADIAHPAFNNLFVYTEYLPAEEAILARRRSREGHDTVIYAINSFCVDGETLGELEYETDRAQFMGRLHSARNPVALAEGAEMKKTSGAVLDPCFALKRRVRIEAGKSCTLTLVTAIADTKEEAVVIAQKYKTVENVQRAFEMAQARCRIENKYLATTEREEKLAYEILPYLVYQLPAQPSITKDIEENNLGQQGLWSFGISGDNPIILVEVSENTHMDIVEELLTVHSLWRLRGIAVDLVILCDDRGSYLMSTYSSVRESVESSNASDVFGHGGGVFALSRDSVTVIERRLLRAVARVVVESDCTSLFDSIKTHRQKFESKLMSASTDRHDMPLTKEDLQFDNGIGGFSGDEYVIHLKAGITTPAPWINVVANKQFGFTVSENGGGYTWCDNSRENKITPWSNDPIQDVRGEAVYICENDSIWSPIFSVNEGNEEYIVRHGFGYTSFEHHENEIKSKATMFCAVDDPAKITLVDIENTSGSPRELKMLYYIDPILNAQATNNRRHITASFEDNTMRLKNKYNSEFKEKVTLIAVSEDIDGYTTDKNELFAGDCKVPFGLLEEKLSNTVENGDVGCSAIIFKIKLDAKERKTFSLVLGQINNGENSEIILKYCDVNVSIKELENVRKYWDGILKAVTVNTPDKTLDAMMNGRLLYQTLACRIFGRTGFYQSGGAYGFRDQLQDTTALLHSLPEIARFQIINASAHQFEEGDVQHWWHPTNNIGDSIPHKGVRTKFSDDLLWLPYVVCRYIDMTHDYAILDEEVSFIKSRTLDESEDERYEKPEISKETGTVYEHCKRAIERSFQMGRNGLPKIGSGDWNDGMNMVGNKGEGESVWLGWFLCTVLPEFSEICERYNDNDTSHIYRKYASDIAKNIDKNAWDGQWYRRAYFDDGSPLGSAQNSECKIDLIAQSWAVISGMADKEKQKNAMQSVIHYLVDKVEGIIKLLTPPFDKCELNPGYIKSYMPGVRENGGQYTHAAAWAILAYALLGEYDTALELFDLINPINHTRTMIEIAKYKTEPYAIAADVYAAENVGRGGWTWYTGASGWLYQVALEGILGIERSGDILKFTPRVPKHWKEFDINYRFGKTMYKIEIKINAEENKIFLDGELIEELRLVDDGQAHNVNVSVV